MTKEEIIQLNTNYLNGCESEHEMNELFNYVLELQKYNQEPYEDAMDAISRLAVLEEINRVGIKAFKTYNDYSQLFDFVDTLPPVKPKDCDTCEVGNPCLYCKHEFEPKVPDTNDGNMSENPTRSESEEV